MSEREPPSRGVRTIMIYKAVKAVLQLALALILVLLLPRGLPDELHALATALREHATHAWAVELSDLIERGSTRHGVVLASIALGLDGSLTAVEAAALRSGRAWGSWLVVVATGALLPLEVLELARSLRPSRALLLAVNLVIVLYLTRRAWHEHDLRRRRASGIP
jgi:uncharacterized membrane protein (DUF2068 family)